jgi:hypothetical protein
VQRLPQRIAKLLGGTHGASQALSVGPDGERSVGGVSHRRLISPAKDTTRPHRQFGAHALRARSVGRGAWVEERGSRSVDRGAWIEERGSRSVDRGAWVGQHRIGEHLIRGAGPTPWRLRHVYSLGG